MNKETLNKTFQKMVHLTPAIVFISALVIVNNQLKDQNISDITSALQMTPVWIIIISLALTLLNYLVLAAYDSLALYFTGHTKIPLPKVIAAALVSYAVSNNTGHSWAAGGSIRYRYYSRWGVPAWDILKISLFLSITYLLGAITLGLVGSLLLPLYVSNTIHDSQTIYWISVVCFATLVAYWGAVLYWRKPINIKGIELHLPSPKMTFWQTVVSSIDIVLSSIVLWVLLLGKVDISFSGFVMVFVVAQVAGVISQVPGGIGVFEGAFLWLMTDIQGSDQNIALMGALMLFRVIYFIIPLLLAGVGLFGYEVHSKHQALAKRNLNLMRLFTAIAPKLYAYVLLSSGSVLIFSGLFQNSNALSLISSLFPLPIDGLPPLARILFGVLTLFLARGIRLRVDAAWYSNVILLGWGIMASLLNDFNWHAAAVISIMLMLMLPTRKRFRRSSSLLQMSYSKYWLSTSSLILLGSVLLGSFAYGDSDSNRSISELFDHGNPVSSVWLLTLVVLLPVCLGLWRLLNVAPPKFLHKPSAIELVEAHKLLVQSKHTQGFLALLGDKYLLWSDERNAFIMFEVTHKFWVALSDPIGEPSAFKSLLRKFQEQADRHGAKPVFYRINAEMLPYYLNLGLSLYKLGEEARISLSDFSLKGKQLDAQRHRRNKFTKMGYQFEILNGESLDSAMPCLKRISDAWMKSKNAREKGFSLGYFNESYIRFTDVAVIKNDAGDIKAFANLWQTANREELAIDLMRYDPDAEKGIMDFLFAELMFWGQSENYLWFSMGLAPLAGLEEFPLAPLWHKIGATLFDNGDKLYNFKGLREYKAKYAPSWESRYLATPGGMSLPFVLISITCVISGGWQGIFTNVTDIKKSILGTLGIKTATKRQNAISSQ